MLTFPLFDDLGRERFALFVANQVIVPATTMGVVRQFSTLVCFLHGVEYSSLRHGLKFMSLLLSHELLVKVVIINAN